MKQDSYTPTSQNDELKSVLEKIYETNRRLVRHSDIKTQSILEKELTDLQRSTHDIELNIRQKRETLYTVRALFCNP